MPFPCTLLFKIDPVFGCKGVSLKDSDFSSDSKSKSEGLGQSYKPFRFNNMLCFLIVSKKRGSENSRRVLLAGPV